MKRLLAVIIAVVMSFTLASPAHAAVVRQPAPYLFGMHDQAVVSGHYPDTTAITTQRLWDAGVTWRDIETSPGVYNWAPLDAAIANLEAHGDSPFLVLGGTPRFYASNPDAPGGYGPGFCSEANLTAWERYVRAVVTRYQGRIDAYEPINEVDIGLFYCGSMEHVLERSRIVYSVVELIDPYAIVTTPSFVDRYASSQNSAGQIMEYLRNGGAKYAEAVSYHPYGMPEFTPEENANISSELRRKMRKYGIKMPVWATEINYGLPIGGGGNVAGDWSEWKQASYMSRTFIAQRWAGVRRVYWYAWSDAPFLGVKLNSVNGKPAAAKAMETMSSWLSHPLTGCQTNARGVWTCRLVMPGRDGYVKWHPTKTVYEKAPAGTLTKRNMYGTLVPKTKRVGIAPVLYR